MWLVHEKELYLPGAHLQMYSFDPGGWKQMPPFLQSCSWHTDELG